MAPSNKRPGVVIYFDIRPALTMLSPSERGELFSAILAFAEDGELPDFSGALGMAWAFIQPKLERDANAYTERCVQRKYAAYCKMVKRDGGNPLPMEEWERTAFSVYENDRELTGVNENNQQEQKLQPHSKPYPESNKTGAGVGKGSGENQPDRLTEQEFNQRREFFLGQLLGK